MGRRIAVVGTLLLALFGVPRTSDAGLLEFIWEMSGPRMLGLGAGCLYSMKMKPQECRIGSALVDHTGQPKKGDSRGPHLVLGGAYLFSTGHDSKTLEYDWFDVHMLVFEPGLTVRSLQLGADGDLRVHHGAGISYDFLFGRDFRRFDKFAFTITPIDVAYRRVAVGVKLRHYPNGFTDDEFQSGPRISQNRPSETTLGFTFSVIFDKNQ